MIGGKVKCFNTNLHKLTKFLATTITDPKKPAMQDTSRCLIIGFLSA